DEVGFGVDPEDGRSRATPVVVPGAQCTGRDLAQGRGETQAETDAFVGRLRKRADRQLREVLAARQMVHVHQFERAWAEDARPVELAATAKHLAKTMVVA